MHYRSRYKCANYGDQGISINCSDIYKHNIDCQWVDISELKPGQYTFKVPTICVKICFINIKGVRKKIYDRTANNVTSMKSRQTEFSYFQVAVNPEFKVGEMSFDNNAAICRLLYTETFATVHSCIMGRPWHKTYDCSEFLSWTIYGVKLMSARWRTLIMHKAITSNISRPHELW